jgi:hypothetical protein
MQWFQKYLSNVNIKLQNEEVIFKFGIFNEKKGSLHAFITQIT